MLATILTASAAPQAITWGATLLALHPVRCLGIVHESLSWLRNHAIGIERGGELAMVLGRVLFVTGRGTAVCISVQRHFERFGWPPI